MTAIFHFIFVSLTLGLSLLVAWMESRYVATGDETYLRMTRFWGKLFLINFAVGVVTGLTMEFQFGMNWAEYSKYVGDIFGAPLAIEAWPPSSSKPLPGFVGFRLESGLSPGPRGGHLDRRPCSEPLRLLDPLRQRVDAKSRGIHDSEQPGRAGRFYRLFDQCLQLAQILPHHPGGLCRWGLLRSRHLRLAHPSRKQHRSLQEILQGRRYLRAGQRLSPYRHR